MTARLGRVVKIDGGWFGGYVRPENHRVARINRCRRQHISGKRREGVHASGSFNRYDAKTDIESWAFSMAAAAIGSLCERKLYWLMRAISRAAHGYPDRAYAKWLVLNFAWQSLEPLCRKRSYATAFREAYERNVHVILTPLRPTLDRAFAAAPRFYRLNRGTEPTAIDASTFFKRRNLDKEFAILQCGSRNEDCLTAFSRLGFT